MNTRYFVYRDSDGSVSTVFKGEFEDSRLVGDSYWDSRKQDWIASKSVGKWYFMGDTDMDVSTEEEVMVAIELWREKYPPRN